MRKLRLTNASDYILVFFIQLIPSLLLASFVFFVFHTVFLGLFEFGKNLTLVISLILSLLSASLWIASAFGRERLIIQKRERRKRAETWQEQKLKEKIAERVKHEKNEELKLKRHHLKKAREEKKLIEEKNKAKRRKLNLIYRRVKKNGFFDTGNWTEEEKIKLLLQAGASRKLFSNKSRVDENLSKKLTQEAFEANLLSSIEKFNKNVLLFTAIHHWLNVEAVGWLESRAKDGKDFPYYKNVFEMVDEAIPHCNTRLMEINHVTDDRYRSIHGKAAFTWNYDDFDYLTLRDLASNFPPSESFRRTMNRFLLHSDNFDNLWFFESNNIEVYFDLTNDYICFEKIDSTKEAKIY